MLVRHVAHERVSVKVGRNNRRLYIACYAPLGAAKRVPIVYLIDIVRFFAILTIVLDCDLVLDADVLGVVRSNASLFGRQVENLVHQCFVR